MVTPVRKDSLTDYQVKLATILRITSPWAGAFTGNDIMPNPNARSVRVPDIRVDDYIVDADIARIGASHYEGSEYTSEWKNGLPPIEWRTYSMSRHRAFGFTVFNEQLRYSPIKNLVQEYTARKMQYTVLRDHDKYIALAIVSGHMTGKLVARTSADAVGPVTANAHLISNTGNAADYKWIAEPGEDFDNQIQPSFATIKGMEFDATNPLAVFDNLTLQFSDNWWDTNYGNSERFVFVTPAMELVFTNYLISQGSGTESAFNLLKNGGDIALGEPNGYFGTLKGSWKLIKVHPEFLPKVFVDSNLVVDPTAATGDAGVTLKQVVALAAYKGSAQTYEHFSNRRQEDGGTRFDGTEYVQDFAYDAWVIDQKSEGIVPLFLPSSGSVYTAVSTSFSTVAAKVAAARAQLGTSPEQYPITGYETYLSTPEWFHSPYNNTTNLDEDLDVLETGDVAHTEGGGTEGTNVFQETVEALEAELELVEAIALSETAVRADGANALTLGDHVKVGNGIFEVTTAGTTAAVNTSTLVTAYNALAHGATVTDGTVVYTKVLPD